MFSKTKENTGSELTNESNEMKCTKGDGWIDRLDRNRWTFMDAMIIQLN
jgi:hypothetical protein